jgi:hypothetical protein
VRWPIGEIGRAVVFCIGGRCVGARRGQTGLLTGFSLGRCERFVLWAD